MPIYAYRCDDCGHAKDVLQKLSDPVLTTCPACGARAFSKQLTAAGFQLKGSGWYVTDFKGGATGKGANGKSGDGADGKAEQAETATEKTSDASGNKSAGKPSEAATGKGSATPPAAVPATPASEP
jgi:putative FmdB family regulatory protein